VAAKCDQQLPFLVEDLDAIGHAVGDPDVAVAIDGDTLGTREVSRTVAVLSEGADELAVGVEISMRSLRVSQT
jgi:hypothetical protein